MKSCDAHCRACGQHFLSDDAFDAHRRFAEGHEDDWDYRVCLTPDDTDTLEIADTDGVCEISGATPMLHVPIIRSIERRQEAA